MGGGEEGRGGEGGRVDAAETGERKTTVSVADFTD